MKLDVQSADLLWGPEYVRTQVEIEVRIGRTPRLRPSSRRLSSHSGTSIYCLVFLYAVKARIMQVGGEDCENN